MMDIYIHDVRPSGSKRTRYFKRKPDLCVSWFKASGVVQASASLAKSPGMASIQKKDLGQDG